MRKAFRKWWLQSWDALRSWGREVKSEWASRRPGSRRVGTRPWPRTRAPAPVEWPDDLRDPLSPLRFRYPRVRVTRRGDYLLIEADERQHTGGRFRGRPYVVSTYRYVAHRAPAPGAVDVNKVRTMVERRLTGRPPVRRRLRTIPVRTV